MSCCIWDLQAFWHNLYFWCALYIVLIVLTFFSSCYFMVISMFLGLTKLFIVSFTIICYLSNNQPTIMWSSKFFASKWLWNSQTTFTPYSSFVVNLCISNGHPHFFIIVPLQWCNPCLFSIFFHRLCVSLHSHASRVVT